MKHRMHRRLIVAVFFVLIYIFIGCSSKEEKKAGMPPGQGQSAVTQTPAAISPNYSLNPSAIVIDVDGSKLTQGEVESELDNKMASIQNQIPKEKIEKARAEIRNQIINDFTIKTLLTHEVNRLKINVTEQEFSAALDRFKKNLPQGMTIEELVKKHNMTKEKMDDEIRLGIKFNKLILLQKGADIKPTEKEIFKFYEENRNKFIVPESVHIRHILVAKAAGDDDKRKADKAEKIGKLRKQLLAGADFAELAKSNSDCPSKKNGGDLGTISRGEMVKPFEDAAFTQDKNVIGPVVETEFGYHIIQVLEHNPPKTVSLNDSVKERIADYLKNQKHQEIFDTLLKSLRSKAKIVAHQN